MVEIDWNYIGAVIGGLSIILFGIFKSIVKLRFLYKSNFFYHKKSYKELVHCDMSSQFYNLQYIIKFHTLSPRKKKAFEIITRALCQSYSDQFNLIITKLEGSHPIENYCRLKYNSKLISHCIEIARKKLLDCTDYEYYLKFIKIFDQFTQPFTETLLEEIESSISNFYYHKGTNHSRLLLQISYSHLTFLKLFLKFLNVNCHVMNGQLD